MKQRIPSGAQEIKAITHLPPSGGTPETTARSRGRRGDSELPAEMGAAPISPPLSLPLSARGGAARARRGGQDQNPPWGDSTKGEGRRNSTRPSKREERDRKRASEARERGRDERNGGGAARL
ncbi:hypothetical protein NL676_008004 [Syzygium grande]|nr:hypothetical protein NL676_008004 [Syzygium grande]